MGEEIEIRQSNWVQVPIELLKSALSLEAKALYAVMRSFGPESRASLEGLALRLGAGLPRVKRAQRELELAGWISLASEGKGRGRGQKGAPRIWCVRDTLNPQSLVGGQFEGGSNNGTSKTPPQVREVKDLVREKKTVCVAGSAPTPQAHLADASQSPDGNDDQAWQALKAQHKVLTRQSLEPSRSEAKKNKKIAISMLRNLDNDTQRLLLAHKAFCGDAYWTKQGWPLKGMASQLTQFVAKADLTKPKPTGPCQHPPGKRRTTREWVGNDLADVTRCQCGHILATVIEPDQPAEGREHAAQHAAP